MIRGVIGCLVFLSNGFAAEVKTVDSLVALETAVKMAVAGETIVLKNGVYEQPLKLEAKGLPKQPVMIRAESKGGVVFTRPVKMIGAWMTLEGGIFRNDASVIIQGSNIRLTRATFSNSQSPKWVFVGAGSKEVEIDHCLFENKEINSKRLKGCQTLQMQVHNEQERHYVHHNHFRNIVKGAKGNGFETIQLITYGNPWNPLGGNSETRIEENLFEHCNGESEIISVKASGNQIRRNTFRSCRGGLVLRHGHRNVVSGNFFFGERESGSQGVRLQGKNQIVANNYFQGLDEAAIALMDGTPDELYMRVERAQILHNTVIDCREAMAIGLNHSKHPNGTTPTNCLIAGNAFVGQNSKTGLIRFVQNDIPDQWTWKDNYFQGSSGIPSMHGMTAAKLNLLLDKKLSLARPTAMTPRSARAEDCELLHEDALGVARGKQTAVGAIEYSTEVPKHKPLRAQELRL